MYQQDSIMYIFLFIVFMHSFSMAGSDGSIVYDKAIEGLVSILREEPRVCARAINRFKNEVVPDLEKSNLYSGAMVASIFRCAFIHCLAEHRVRTIPDLCDHNIFPVYCLISSVFSPKLEPWEDFIKNVGILNNKIPDDNSVEKAFMEVRRKTEEPYVANADYIRRQIDAMIAFNTLPPVKDFK